MGGEICSQVNHIQDSDGSNARKAIKHSNVKLLRKVKGVMMAIQETPKAIEGITEDFS